MSTKLAIATSVITIVVLAGVGTGLAQVAAVTRHTAAIEKLDPLEVTAASNQVQTVKLAEKYRAVYDTYSGQVADNAVVDAFVNREAVLRAQGIPLTDTIGTTVRKAEEHSTDWFWDLNRRSDLIDARIVELSGFTRVDVKAETADLNKLTAAADQSHQLWKQDSARHL